MQCRRYKAAALFYKQQHRHCSRRCAAAAVVEHNATLLSSWLKHMLNHCCIHLHSESSKTVQHCTKHVSL
jgi:hypothetical protein